MWSEAGSDISLCETGPSRGRWDTIGLKGQPIAPLGAVKPTKVTFSSHCFCCCFCCSSRFFCLPTFPIAHPAVPPLTLTRHVQNFKRQDQNNLHHAAYYRRRQMSHTVTGTFSQGSCMTMGLVGQWFACSREHKSRFSAMFWKALLPLCVTVWLRSTCCAWHSAHVVQKSGKTSKTPRSACLCVTKVLGANEEHTLSDPPSLFSLLEYMTLLRENLFFSLSFVKCRSHVFVEEQGGFTCDVSSSPWSQDVIVAQL